MNYTTNLEKLYRLEKRNIFTYTHEFDKIIMLLQVLGYYEFEIVNKILKLFYDMLKFETTNTVHNTWINPFKVIKQNKLDILQRNEELQISFYTQYYKIIINIINSIISYY